MAPRRCAASARRLPPDRIWQSFFAGGVPGGPPKRPARTRMPACPKCGGTCGFIETLACCTVVRRVDAEFEHVELIDWDPTPESRSTYRCVRCGARFSAEELEAR